MLKAFYTYLFTLCVFLLGGYQSQLPAQADAESLFGSQEGKVCAEIGPAFGHEAYIYSTTSEGTFKDLLFEVFEEVEVEEEEETASSKKYAAGKTFIAALYNTHLSEFFHLSYKKCTTFGKHFSYFQSNRLYLIFEVFRL